MAAVPPVGPAFFPLDEALGLLPGRYTPRLQEAMTRLGSKLPFQQAAGEIFAFCRTHIAAATVRRTTHHHGRASEACSRQTVARLEAEAPEAPVAPGNVVLSTDGAFVPLDNGQWREVKTVAVGTYEQSWSARTGQMVVQSGALSYFSRSYRAREFERYALGELHRRGVARATQVVAVNDGAAWIQSFLDYHCPQAVRIIDFAHALSYVAQIGKTILGEDSAAFAPWFQTHAHQLKHQPPGRLLSELTWFGERVTTDEQEAAVDHALRYLRQRQAMIDYRHFRRCGYPIGSGSVESSHKHVVHSRLKGAGMRWAERHVDPLLSLRNLIANDRWDEGWQALVRFQQQERWRARQPAPPQPPPPITLASVRVAPAAETALTDAEPPPKVPWRPAATHPWRRPWKRRRRRQHTQLTKM